MELFVIAWFYVETKGPTLEEIAKIFDGDHAETGIANLHDVKADMRVQDVMEKFGTFTKVEAVQMEDRGGRRNEMSPRSDRGGSGGSMSSWAFGEKPKARVERVPSMPRRTGSGTSGNENLLPISPTREPREARFPSVRSPRTARYPPPRPTRDEEDEF